MKKSRILITACAIALILSTVFSFTSCTSLESTAKELETVMTIDGFDVSYELLRYALLNTKDDIDGRNDAYWNTIEDKDALVARIFTEAVDTIKNRYAVLSLAKDYGISMDDQLIKDKISNTVSITRNQYENDKAYLAALKKEHMNHSVYSFLIGLEYCNEELYYAMVNKGDITNDTKEIKTIVESDEFIRIKQVLIKFDSDGDGKEDGTREEKYQRACQILQLASDGNNFDDLVQTYGQDISMFNNPDGYYMTRGSDYIEFEEAAFALEIGGISEIVETPVGYSIIKRYEKEADYIEDNLQQLSYYYASCQFSLALEAKLAVLEVKTTDAYNGIDIFNMK